MPLGDEWMDERVGERVAGVFRAMQSVQAYGALYSRGPAKKTETWLDKNKLKDKEEFPEGFIELRHL